MKSRPKTLDEVDYQAAAEALLASFPGETPALVLARAEGGAIAMDALGNIQEAEALRRTAAVIRKRLYN